MVAIEVLDKAHVATFVVVVGLTTSLGCWLIQNDHICIHFHSICILVEEFLLFCTTCHFLIYKTSILEETRNIYLIFLFHTLNFMVENI